MGTEKTYDAQELATEILAEHPVLVEKIARACEISNEEVPNCFSEVLRFLWLIGTFNRPLTPSLQVDLAWHEFILFTRLYHGFCEQHFSRFIHHSPGGDPKVNALNFEKTIQLYIVNIGQPPAAYWGHRVAQEWKDLQCGSCSN